jgi:hypothetical protein
MTRSDQYFPMSVTFRVTERGPIESGSLIMLADLVARGLSSRSDALELLRVERDALSASLDKSGSGGSQTRRLIHEHELLMRRLEN